LPKISEELKSNKKLSKYSENLIQQILLKEQSTKLELDKEINDIDRNMPATIQNPQINSELIERRAAIAGNLDSVEKKIDNLILLKYYIQHDVVGKQATSTQWIHYEVDKLVSVIYFFVILLIFTLALTLHPTTFANHLLDFSKSFGNKTLQASMTFALATQMVGILTWIFIMVSVGIGITIWLSFKKLRTYINMVSLYMLVNGSEKPRLREYADKVGQYISSREWEMAGLWAKILEDKL
jgi:hypothetical protein